MKLSDWLQSLDWIQFVLMVVQISEKKIVTGLKLLLRDQLKQVLQLSIGLIKCVENPKGKYMSRAKK